MRKLAVVLIAAVLLAAVGGSAFAAGWDSWLHKGNLNASLGLGLHLPFGLAVYPGVEWSFYDWRIGDVVPLNFGAVGKGIVDWWPDWGVSFGAGGFLSAHLGLKGLDIPEFLQKFDFYVALGLALVYGSWYQDYYKTGGTLRFGLGSFDGLNYFLKDNLAIFAEWNYWAHFWGGAIGILWKLK